jgi:carbonic anhydrase
MSVTGEYLENNASYALTHVGGLSVRPSKRVAVVACMDSRLKIFPMLGMTDGEAHVIRNAGGVITDDVVRSLAISQRKLGTREIILIHHTDCGLLTLTDDSFKRELQDDTGLRPPWAVEAFTDVYEDTRQSVSRVLACPYLPHRDRVRGFVFDVDTGLLNEVGSAANPGSGRLGLPRDASQGLAARHAGRPWR